MRDMGYGIQIEPSICWVGFGTAHSKEEHLDHARLILAAPELLDGLRKAVSAFNHISRHSLPEGDSYKLAAELKDLIDKATNPQ